MLRRVETNQQRPGQGELALITTCEPWLADGNVAACGLRVNAGQQPLQGRSLQRSLCMGIQAARLEVLAIDKQRLIPTRKRRAGCALIPVVACGLRHQFQPLPMTIAQTRAGLLVEVLIEVLRQRMGQAEIDRGGGGEVEHDERIPMT